MRSLADTLRDARENAELSEPMMARLVGIELGQLRRFEAGAEEIPAAVLERYGLTFGLGIRPFMKGEAPRAPMRMLFRSMLAGSRPSVTQLADTGTHLVLGDFLRCVRDIVELRERLGERKDTSLLEATRPIPIKPGSAPPHGAEELAKRARERLGLGTAPIPSMLELVEEKLGIDVLWVTPDELDRDIDAASALAPNPAILVNLVGGAEQWWRTRMTLAHEVCHLLFDRDFLAGARKHSFVLFSPSPPPNGMRKARPSARRIWYFSEQFESIEQRANAFAAYFLAPPDGVRALVHGRDASSEEAIVAVCGEYGLGRETAINVLTNVHGLSPHVRLSMVTRLHAPVFAAYPHGRFREKPREKPGLRRGLLEDLALRALAKGSIDRAEARDYLRWPLTEPIPAHPSLSEAQRAPLRPIEDKVRLYAERYLSSCSSSEVLYAAEVSRAGEGWQVEVVGGRGQGPFRPVGSLRMSQGLEVLKDESRLELKAAPAKDGGPRGAASSSSARRAPPSA